MYRYPMDARRTVPDTYTPDVMPLNYFLGTLQCQPLHLILIHVDEILLLMGNTKKFDYSISVGLAALSKAHSTPYRKAHSLLLSVCINTISVDEAILFYPLAVMRWRLRGRYTEWPPAGKCTTLSRYMAAGARGRHRYSVALLRCAPFEILDQSCNSKVVPRLHNS